jgi:hypothetical protein
MYLLSLKKLLMRLAENFQRLLLLLQLHADKIEAGAGTNHCMKTELTLTISTKE